MQLLLITCTYMHYVVLYDVTCFTPNNTKLHVLHTLIITFRCIYYIHLHIITWVSCFFMTLHALCPTEGNNLQIDPPVPPLPVHLNHPRIPAQPAARPSDPSLLIGKLCSALHAGPDEYYKAVAAWHAKFPVAAFPDPGKHFLICEGNEPQKCT